MNIIEKLEITPVTVYEVDIKNDLVQDYCEAWEVGELEEQRDEMLEALIDILRILEPPMRDFTGAWVYKHRKTVEKATNKTWEEIKEIL